MIINNMVKEINGNNGARSEVQKMIADLNRRDASLTPDEKYFVNSDLANLDWRTSPSWRRWLSALWNGFTKQKKR